MSNRIGNGFDADFDAEAKTMFREFRKTALWIFGLVGVFSLLIVVSIIIGLVIVL